MCCTEPSPSTFKEWLRHERKHVIHPGTQYKVGSKDAWDLVVNASINLPVASGDFRIDYVDPIKLIGEGSEASRCRSNTNGLNAKPPFCYRATATKGNLAGSLELTLFESEFKGCSDTVKRKFTKNLLLLGFGALEFESLARRELLERSFEDCYRCVLGFPERLKGLELPEHIAVRGGEEIELEIALLLRGLLYRSGGSVAEQQQCFNTSVSLLSRQDILLLFSVACGMPVTLPKPLDMWNFPELMVTLLDSKIFTEKPERWLLDVTNLKNWVLWLGEHFSMRLPEWARVLLPWSLNQIPFCELASAEMFIVNTVNKLSVLGCSSESDLRILITWTILEPSSRAAGILQSWASSVHGKEAYQRWLHNLYHQENLAEKALNLVALVSLVRLQPEPNCTRYYAKFLDLLRRFSVDMAEESDMRKDLVVFLAEVLRATELLWARSVVKRIMQYQYKPPDVESDISDFSEPSITLNVAFGAPGDLAPPNTPTGLATPRDDQSFGGAYNGNFA